MQASSRFVWQLVGASVAVVAFSGIASARPETDIEETTVEEDGVMDASAMPSYLASDETTTPQRFVVEDLDFETGSAELPEDAEEALEEVAEALTSYPNVSIQVEGYTDATGGEDYNQQLSQARADAVKDYLVDEGISPDRVASVGRGEENPIGNNRTEEGREENRRTEVIVTEM